MDRVLVDRLLGRIAAALVLGPACTDRGLGDDDSGGGEQGMGDATSQTASASASQGEATRGDDSPGDGTPQDDTRGEDTGREPMTDADDDGDEGILFDVGRTPDVRVPPPPPPIECDAPAPPSSGRGCTEDVQEEYSVITACIEMPAEGCPQWNTLVVDDAVQTCSSTCFCVEEICGPDPTQSDCCYWSIATGNCCPGRPFVVHGRDRLAELTTRADWADATAIDTRALSPELRGALARAWAEDARCEHAAVASFARFTLQLLAVAAPADLVLRAQRAGLDELAHARAFFGLASAYGGAPVGPGSLDTTDALADGNDLEHVVVATVREGCIAETISLVQLATALAHVRDPALHAMLAAIVDEELEHVELAWSFVAWALARGDERLFAAVTAALAAAESAIPRAVAIDPAAEDAPTWAAHGRLSRAESAALARATLRDIVGPSAARLLGSRARPRASVVSADPGMR